MSEMIERVAFATCSSKPCICKNKAGFNGMPCLDRARAAIESMREPTPDPLAAAGAATPSGCHWAMPKEDGEGRHIVLGQQIIWTAMIDAALVDKP